MITFVIVLSQLSDAGHTSSGLDPLYSCNWVQYLICFACHTVSTSSAWWSYLHRDTLMVPWWHLASCNWVYAVANSDTGHTHSGTDICDMFRALCICATVPFIYLLCMCCSCIVVSPTQVVDGPQVDKQIRHKAETNSLTELHKHVSV